MVNGALCLGRLASSHFIGGNDSTQLATRNLCRCSHLQAAGQPRQSRQALASAYLPAISREVVNKLSLWPLISLPERWLPNCVFVLGRAALSYAAAFHSKRQLFSQLATPSCPIGCMHPPLGSSSSSLLDDELISYRQAKAHHWAAIDACVRLPCKVPTDSSESVQLTYGAAC